jgi:hypothetical protein
MPFEKKRGNGHPTRRLEPAGEPNAPSNCRKLLAFVIVLISCFYLWRRENMKKEAGRPLHLRLDDGGPFVVWDDDEQARPRHGLVVRTLICDNPECECRQVQIRAVAVDDQLKGRGVEANRSTFRLSEEDVANFEIPEKQLCAVMDVDTGEVSLAEGAPGNEDNLEMLRLLKEKMKGDLLETVRRRWRAVKKEFDIEQWQRQDWSWWEPGLLVSWAEVFPDDLNFLVGYGGAIFWANDMYCINPGCPCQTVMITFRQVHGKSSIEAEDIGTVAINLGKWRVEGIDPKQGDPKRLRSLWELLNTTPDFRLTLRERRRDLRAIGREIVRMGQREEREKTVPNQKTGRNDPCPCGSGKKYKKCCLDKKLSNG